MQHGKISVSLNTCSSNIVKFWVSISDLKLISPNEISHLYQLNESISNLTVAQLTTAYITIKDQFKSIKKPPNLTVFSMILP